MFKPQSQHLAARTSYSKKLVVVGLIHVGFPVASSFADKGLVVSRIDIQSERIDKINSGSYDRSRSPTDDRVYGNPHKYKWLIPLGFHELSKD